MESNSSYSLLQITLMAWDMVFLILKDRSDQNDTVIWISCVFKQANY